ncbi:MAG: LytR C-terminal domain-containing protein, partial [Solirubrobacteraceae bacterium]
GGPKYFKPERSSGRALVLIAGGTIVGVLLLLLAVSALKGGGGGGAATATQSSSPAAETQPASTHTRSTTAHATASNPAETAVAVLNGTGTAGLAHHLAADLQQGGYARAAALAGVPPGTHASTVVQYTHGHRADAQAVAKALNVTQVEPVETTIVPLAGSATVVVLAGADQASQLGGGGAQSNGEPGAGTGGEGTAPAGQ